MTILLNALRSCAAKKMIKYTNLMKAYGKTFEKSSIHVSLKQGELKGTLEQTDSGVFYSSFKGIPYAIPPIGKLRFRAPLPHTGWKGVLDASEHRGICPQRDAMTGGILEGNEDCLFVNVYSPFDNKSKLPVMVWFHGGGFVLGSGDSFMYGPDYLIEENVVLVTVNYRLEVLGFLCLETEEVPGNAGMKDQVLALKWVKENISKFGGDPNSVTIFGESAGGICCTYHLVSPMSRGLFHKVIAQSGCFFNEWAKSFDNVNRAFRLGKYLGIETNDKSRLLAYLRSLPAEKLANVSLQVRTEEEIYRGMPVGFSPVKEICYDGQESFLPKTGRSLLMENKFMDVPILLGYNSMECIFTIRSQLKRVKDIHDYYERNIPRSIAYRVTKEVLKSMGEQLKNFYFGNKIPGEGTLEEIIKMESDFVIIYHVQKFAKEVAKIYSSPIYLNRFSFDGNLNFLKSTCKHKHVKGASHGDDLFYIFKTFADVENGSNEHKTVRRMTKMWTNFAKYGNPIPQADPLLPVNWKPVTPTETNFLEIDFELSPGIDPDKDRYDFWSGLEKQAKEFQRKFKSHL